MLKVNKKAQTLLEYCLLIVILVGAMSAMAFYIKRGIQGRWKKSVDSLGDQYDPRFADTDLTVYQQVNSDTSIYAINTSRGYWTLRTDVSETSERRSGHTGVRAY